MNWIVDLEKCCSNEIFVFYFCDVYYLLGNGMILLCSQVINLHLVIDNCLYGVQIIMGILFYLSIVKIFVSTLTTLTTNNQHNKVQSK